MKIILIGLFKFCYLISLCLICPTRLQKPTMLPQPLSLEISLRHEIRRLRGAANEDYKDDREVKNLIFFDY